MPGETKECGTPELRKLGSHYYVVCNPGTCAKPKECFGWFETNNKGEVTDIGCTCIEKEKLREAPSFHVREGKLVEVHSRR